LFLVMSFYEKVNSMNGTYGATAGYEASLVGGKPDDLANTSIHNSFEYLHTVREQSDWTIIVN
uniref:Copper-containing nitrite reductase n=1 Tax=Heligmosomoides polygyrus TaxID=6339 RepID=A0A183GUR0_HELPZ